MKVKSEFAGGAELLFGSKSLDLELEDDSNIKQLISVLCDEHIKRDRHLFEIGGKIRPGILILVNEIDFEILGKYDCKLKPNDVVLFVSTLHGG